MGAATQLAPHALGRDLTGAEIVSLGLAVAAVLGRLWWQARNRERRNLEDMRDSALW